jgi:hypothetical protein
VLTAPAIHHRASVVGDRRRAAMPSRRPRMGQSKRGGGERNAVPYLAGCGRSMSLKRSLARRRMISTRADRTVYAFSLSSSASAAFRSAVSKPSVNHKFRRASCELRRDCAALRASLQGYFAAIAHRRFRTAFPKAC